MKSSNGTRPDSIGIAQMLPDGTLVLDLRATGDGGMVGDARVVYKPNDPNYHQVLHRLGPMKPGDQRPVPPFD